MFESGDHSYEGCLSASGGAENRKKRSAVYLERNIVNSEDLAKALGDMPALKVRNLWSRHVAVGLDVHKAKGGNLRCTVEVIKLCSARGN